MISIFSFVFYTVLIVVLSEQNIFSSTKSSLDFSNNKNVILVVGNTVSGKSTLVHYVAGDPSKLTSVESSSGLEIEIDPENVGITLPTVLQILVPNEVIDDQQNVWFDCPSLGEISKENEIANAVLIESVIESYSNIKIVLVVDYDSVQNSQNYSDFDNLLKRTTELIKNVKQFENSFSLVVTKAPSYYIPNQKSFETSVENVKNTTADFLSKHPLRLQNVTTDEKLLLINSLLKQTKEETYPKISVFWKPEEVGRLSEFDKFVKGRELIRKSILENTAYTQIQSKYVNYELSEEAIEHINSMQDQAVESFNSQLKNISDRVQNEFNQTIQSQHDFEEMLKIIHIGRSKTEYYEKIHPFNLKNLTELFGKLIKEISLQSIKKHELTQIEREENYLNVLKSIVDMYNFFGVSASDSNRIDYKSLLNETSDFFKKCEIEIKNKNEVEISQIMNNISNSLPNVDQQLLAALQEKLEKSHGILNKLNFLKTGKKSIEYVGNAKTLEQRIEQFSTLISNLNITSIDIKQIERNSLYLNKFMSSVKSTMIPDVVSCIVNSTRSIEFVSSEYVWYSFLSDVYNFLASYEVQKDVSAYNVADLSNWGESENSQDLVITTENFKNFTQQFKNLINFVPKPSKLNELNQIIDTTLKSPVTYHFHSKRAIIEGNFVKSSDFHLINRTSFSTRKIKKIDVFVADTFYVDSDLNLTGIENVELNILANKWNILQPTTFRLNVIDDASQATPTTIATFFGMANKIVNENLLTIELVDGSGGSGRDRTCNEDINIWTRFKNDTEYYYPENMPINILKTFQSDSIKKTFTKANMTCSYSCDQFYYRDTNNRSAGHLGTCIRCPCENADSCKLESNGNILCNCYPGFVGDRCTDDNEICLHSEFQCDQFKCILSTQVCDAIVDCVDGSDEIYCDIHEGVIAGKPRVELRPTYIDVNESSPVEVECLATSPTPVTYHWTRLDAKLSPDAHINGQWLRFNQVRRSDIGAYQCIARNQYGDDSIVLIVYVRESNPTPPPYPSPSREVSIHPKRFSGRSGDSLVLTCSNVINVYATFIWNKAGLKELPSHVYVRNGVLTIQNVRVEDSGRYICTSWPSTHGQPIESFTEVADVVITDYETDDGQSSNDPIYVKPLEQMYTAMQSSDFSLICEASGSPYPAVSWKKIHEDSLGSNVQQIGNTLKIVNVQPENRGIYQCIATSNEETADTSTVIQVERREAPIVEIHPDEPQTVRVGESVMLSCRATGGYPTPTVVWSRSDREPLSQRVEELNVGTILISNITIAEHGQYECQATNVVGVAKQTAVVHVQEPPMIRILPETTELTITEGDELKLECFAEGSPLPTVQWKRQDPSSGAEKIIPGVQSFGITQRAQSLIQKYNANRSDEGTYICYAGNAAGEDQKYITIFVQPKSGDVAGYPNTIASNCRPDQFSCKSDPSSCIEISQVCDNVFDCFDHSDELDCSQYLRNRSKKDDMAANKLAKFLASQPVAPYLKLEPARSFLHPGDSIVVDCKSSSSESIVTWKREGYQRLPFNFRQQGNQLFISNVQSGDAGRYICVCKATNGQVSELEYELNVEIPAGSNEVKPAEIEHAEAGSNVVLNCNPGRFANKYHWSRQQGYFAADTDITSIDLRLYNVQAKDAGTYICTASSGAQSSEISITLVVTGAIPYFSQAPKSYLIFSKLENSYMRFNFEVSFNPEKDNGLILYNAQRHGEGHYISLSLNDGYPEFRFNSFAKPVIVRAEKPIELKKWHTIKVNKVRNEGYLMVDDQRPVTFIKTSNSGVELLENLYLGGVPNFKDIASSAVHSHEGYVGCISRLILKDREIELNKEAIGSEGTTSCETCSDDVCANEGVCLETQTEEGFTCVCKSGFTGKTCAVEGLSCWPGICGTGRCENTDFGIECFCPLNKTGDRCQYTEHLDESNLSFKDGSFVAFKTPKSTKLNIRFNIKPENNQDSILLYVAESEHADGDFAALVIKNKHYEFRFNTGGRVHPVIIRSEKEVDVNKWTSISLGRRHGEGFLKIDNAPQVTGKAIGPAHTMYLKTNLYIGGYDKRVLLNKGIEVNRGFDGCISGLEVSSEKINMVKSQLDGANIQNCGDTNEIATEDPSNPAVCKPGYGGYNCEQVVDACIAYDPCENNGLCETKGNKPMCKCPIHFTGEVCQHSAPIEFSSQYVGNGYIELNSSALVEGPNEKDILFALLFSTKEPNGLLVWYGQNNGITHSGQDFMALAVVDGYLEFVIRLDGEETSVKNVNIRVDDGARHVAVLQRNGNHVALELDNFTVYGEIEEASRNYTILPGNIFIGGAPDINRFTGDRYRLGFNGCIHIIEGIDIRPVNIHNNAVSGYNVTPCTEEPLSQWDI